MSTSTEIATVRSTSLGEKMDYARALAEANLLPRAFQKNPGNVLLAVEMGESLNIPTIQAINSIHVIEGKPSASAALISALVRRAGHKLRVTGDDTHAVAQIIRADDPDFTYESKWDLKRAQAAGLTGKGVWKSYPAAMLKARAITEVSRDACQEALMGVQYTPEELGAEVDSDGDPVQVHVGTPVRTEPVPTDYAKEQLLNDASVASTVDEVRDLWESAKTASWFDADVQGALTARVAELKANDDDAVHEAVIVDDTAEQPMATRAQLEQVSGYMKDFGPSGRTEQIRFVQTIVERPDVSNRAQLTEADAAQLLTVLSWCADQEDSSGALADLVAAATADAA